MRKIVIHKPGGHERLRIEECDAPTPGPGQVLIEVEAIGVNYADCMIRMGLYKSSREQVGWPVTPGFEVAGRVARVGKGVGDLEIGARVFAVTLFGGYATQIVVDRIQVFRIPAALRLEQAAAIPAVFLTAYYALFELGHPRGGEHMLVHSAAGGVGGALTQLGRIAGCTVTAVVGAAEKIETAASFGAELVVDRSREDLWAIAETAAPRGFDLIFDANGVATLAGSYRHLGSPGKLIVYGFHSMLSKGRDRPSYLKLALSWWRTPRFDPLLLTNRNQSIMGFNLSYLFDQAPLFASMMRRIVGWIEEGRVVAPPVTTFDLDDVAEAHAALESGRTIGKLVLLKR